MISPWIRPIDDTDVLAPEWATCVAIHIFIVSLLRLGMAQRTAIGRIDFAPRGNDPLRVYFEFEDDALMWKLNF